MESEPIRMSRRFEITTSKPCTQDWDAMSGDGRQRHCAECGKTVHNFARMRRSDVENLAVAAANGEQVCARITRRSDGSLVTLDGERRAGLRAGVLLSAAMMVGQAAAQNPTEARAIVSGRLLTSDGQPFQMSRGRITLRSSSGELMIYPIYGDGEFVFSTPPGQYDVIVRGNMIFAEEIKGATLHAGNQSLGNVTIRPLGQSWDSGMFETVTGGDISVRVGWRYHLRHPVAYLRYIGRKL